MFSYTRCSDDGKKIDEDPKQESECKDQEKEDNVNNTNNVNVDGTNRVNVVGANSSIELSFNLEMPELEDISAFTFSNKDEDDGAEADMNNLDTTIQVSPTPTIRIHKDHPIDQVIRDLHSTTQTINMSKNLEEHSFITNIHQRTNHKDLQNCLFASFLSQEEPKKDERGIMIRNKARLVTQGHAKEEGIDYDEVFSLFARIEAIRLFLAYASFKDFMMYQMDVKWAFLYGKIEEEGAYGCILGCCNYGIRARLRSVEPRWSAHMDLPRTLQGAYECILERDVTLYGLHQAPIAWYETLSTYLLDNEFHRGRIDKTLFIRRHKDDILLVQVYADDIIFGSTKKELCNTFEKMMHEKFQMSSIRELTFFIGLQMKQKQDGIFISQGKYVAEILKKYGFLKVKNASMPMKTQKPMLKDEDREEVDVHMYRLMISSVMYLASSRPNIMFALKVNAARHNLLLLGFELIINFIKANPIKYALTVYTSCIEQFWATVKAKTINGEVQLQALVVGKKVIITESTIRRDLKQEDTKGVDCLPNAAIFEQLTLMRKTKRKDTKLPQTSVPISVADEAVNEEMDDSFERAATTATSLNAEQDKGNIFKIQSKATPNEPVLKELVQVVVLGFNTPQSVEDSLKFIELMELCTNLQNRVLDLETTNTTQEMEIESLKRRVKKLEKKQRSRTHKLKRLYKVGLLARVEFSDDEEVFVAQQNENVVEKEVDAAQVQVSTAVTTPIISTDEATLAQALTELKHANPKTKAKGIVFFEPEVSTTTTTAIPKPKS
nr:hypothetical protein [Tanacetum cinerariifolium]